MHALSLIYQYFLLQQDILLLCRHHNLFSSLQASGRNLDDSSRYCHIPSNLEQQLMPFQREGVQFALRHGGRALIGDEMGLGKVLVPPAVLALQQ